MFWNRKPQLPKIGGYIAHYGLTDWWLTSFTPDERAFIEERYKPMGGDGKLTSGQVGMVYKLGNTEQTVSDFLTTLASWFKRKDQVHLGLRMLEEAKRHEMPPIDEHFLLTTYIGLRYKQRNDDSEAINDVVEACERMISIAPTVVKAFKRTYKGMEPAVPPKHVGYNQLRIIRKKQGDKVEAERLQAEFERVWRD